MNALEKELDKEIKKKMAELRASLTAKSRLDKKLEAVAKGEDRTFWKDGFTTVRIGTILRRRVG